MKIAVISFTKNGYNLSQKLKTLFDYDITLSCGSTKIAEYLNISYIKLSDWVSTNFNTCDNLIFIGATGIAIRSIANFIKSKTTDPAVIVIDETGQFVIPLLSGHIGGANKLAQEIANKINATPVITTATDVNNLFAVDTFAISQNLKICNPEKIKNVSSKILLDKKIIIKNELTIIGKPPENVVFIDENSTINYDVIITRNPSIINDALVLFCDDKNKIIYF